MQNRIRMLVSVLLAIALILSVTLGVTATEPEHEHEWAIQNRGSQGHGLICNICGEKQHEAHTVDSSEICIVCGYLSHDCDKGTVCVNPNEK